ncbi:MAG: DNA mismatch repair endonuclease MutL [Dehalococcoidia bacterium]|nr:DNA mismatch repair endonuclease MutL [Dehalococcoidia bacterium]
MTPGAIRVLAPEVAARIAAGEVIERPVSVVRELLDNAIDSGASRVSVEVEDGGLRLIRVTDNGRGIPPGDLEIAFERHATSKISALDDLGRVHTLGFRGEALPSIAAAADVEITTRAISEPVGSFAVLVDARVVRRQAKAAPTGTTLAIRDLFGRLPARRKFLSSSSAEARRVAVLVTHYALAYPGTAFTLETGGRTLVRTAGDGDLRHAFASIYGADSGEAMLAVCHEESGVAVEGLAAPPSVNRGNRSAISVFVNGRWVQSRPLVFAIVDAYQSQLPVGRHPVAALALHLGDDEVDVNVHPAKAEVRFRDERAVARAVRHAVSTAIEGAPAVGWSGSTAIRPATVPQQALGPGLLPLRDRLQPPDMLKPPGPVQAAMELARGPVVPRTSRPQRETLPLLRVVGQLAATYVVAEGPDGMYLVDQHAAHERVVYDRLLARGIANAAQQPLLEPLLLELDPIAAVTALEHVDHLARLGLELEPFGQAAFLLRSAPAGLNGSDILGAVRSLLDQLHADRRVQDPFARAAATVACHSSVRAGMGLALDEMRRLIEDLETTASPRTCPHGRPTLVHMGTELIERQFGRR